MANPLPYYPRYPRDLVEGTVGMTFELKTTYAFIIDLIYMQNGRLPDDARYIAGLLNCSVRKWNSIKKELLRLDKIQLTDGFISNYRAVTVLESLGKYQDKQAKNRSASNKNNDLQKPWLNHTDTDTDVSEEVRTSSGEPPDFKKQLFDEGVEYLCSFLGCEKSSQARSFLGKMLKGSGDDPVPILNLIRQAKEKNVADPISWISAANQNRPKNEAISFQEQERRWEAERQSAIDRNQAVYEQRMLREMEGKPLPTHIE